MATTQLDCVLHHVRKLIGIQRETDLTDGELLSRFLARQDESAFATLVRRHGPMVARVCRRVLGDAHAAEDAFQATFLVLARKAASIRRRSSVGGWLYEVAYHLATRARASAVRRAWHERQAHGMPRADTMTTEEQEELQAVMDEELHRLPEKYRTPLVLCYLEGKTNTQAASELGCPAGSMSTRLARAREMLRDRLAGRGVALSAGGLLALLGESTATAAVPAALVQNTVQAAVLFAAGKTSVAGIATVQAVVLAEGMLNTMISTKLKLVATLLFAVGILGSGTSALVQFTAVAQATGSAEAAQERKAAEAPATDAVKGDVYGDPLPEGALARMGTLRWRHGAPVSFVGYLADGKQLLTASQDGFFRVWEVATGKEIRRFGKGQAVAANGGWAVAGAGAITIGGANTATNVALSPDGQLLAVAAADGAVRLWDVATGKDVRGLTHPQADAQVRFYGTVPSLAFSADGKSLATRWNGPKIHLWSVADVKEIRSIGKDPANPRRFYGNSGLVAFAPDGKTLAAVNLEVENNQQRALIQFYEVESGKELHQIKAPQGTFNIMSMAFAPDSKGILFSSTDGTIRVHEADTGKEVRQLGQAQQGVYHTTLLFAPDGKTLATRATNNPAIKLWDFENGKELRPANAPEAPQGNVFGKVGLAVGSTQALAFSPDSKVLAEGTPSHTVRLWEVATGKEILPAAGHQGGVSSLSVSPDGKVLTTLGADNTIRQWDVATGKELRQFKLPDGSANPILSADGKLLVCGVANNAVKLWDVATVKELRTIGLANPNNNLGGLVGGLGGMALSPDGKVLAVRGFTPAIQLFDTATGKEISTLAEANPNANNPGGLVAVAFPIGYGARSILAFSPDGSTLATLGAPVAGNANQGIVIVNGRAQGSNKVAIQLWNVALGKKTRQFETERGVEALAFAPDGRTIVTANQDQTISLWEVITGKECCVFKKPAQQPAQAEEAQPNVQKAVVMMQLGGFGQGGASIHLSVSPDGRTLAAGGADRVLRLWDMTSGKELGQFTGHVGGILSVAFAPDSQTLLTGSLDTTATVWDGGRFIKKDVVPAAELTSQQVEGLWTDLAGDPEKAFRAIGSLRAAPKQAVALLQERVKAAKGVEPKRIDQLVTDLDSAQFAVRQQANDELERLAEQAQPALQKALAGNPALETRQRIERLLEQLHSGQAPPPEVLRDLRAVRVLEQAGTPEARQALDTLAKGAAGDKLTREAEAALKRLSK